MKKIFAVVATIFLISTSYISSDEASSKSEGSHLRDTLVAPATFASLESSGTSDISFSEKLYQKLDFKNINILKLAVFEKALAGFNNLKKAGKINQNTKYLTVCDFSLSSTQKRLWVIDTENGAVVFNTLVAHGKNTGEEFAQNFSNTDSSLQSSLGFYITEDTYTGDNGYSLRLEGMDPGFNDHALSRSIVMHGADYVSDNFIKSQHRIGRSWGCPAVSRELAQPIINTIKGKNVLFIYYPDENYLKSSQWLQNS